MDEGKRYGEFSAHERVMLQDDFDSYLVDLKLSNDNLSQIGNELNQNKEKTLGVLEKTVWKEVPGGRRLWLKIRGRKQLYLQDILEDASYREHELCKTHLIRYDLYVNHVQVGKDLTVLYKELELLIWALKKYQEKGAEKDNKRMYYQKELEYIGRLPKATERAEERLNALQIYLRAYLHLSPKKQQLLQTIVREHCPAAELKELPHLEEQATREKLISCCEDAKHHLRKKLSTLLEKVPVYSIKKKNLEVGSRDISHLAETVYENFRHTLLLAVNLRDQYDTIGELKNMEEIINPRIVEVIKKSEELHKKIAEVLKRNGEATLRMILEMKGTLGEKEYEDKLENELKKEADLHEKKNEERNEERNKERDEKRD